MSTTVRLPKGKGPEINVTQHGVTRTFKVAGDDSVQCETSEDANLLVRLIDGSSIVETAAPAPSAPASAQSKENA